MQLKIQRSQRDGGIIASSILFCLDVRADYSPDERDNIRKYNLGNQIIYNSRAARQHLEKSGRHLDRTQQGSVANRTAGLARGALSLAMAKMSLNISIESLARGHHIECKDLPELLEAEETVRDACKNVTKYLEVAATFNGGETVIEYDNGEETVHVTPVAPALLTYGPSDAAPTGSSMALESYSEPAFDVGHRAREIWSKPQYRKLIYYGAGILFLLFLLRSCT